MPARRSDEQADISVLAFGRRDLWGGPYSPCFYDAVERRGVPVIEAMEAGRSLLRNATSHRILHIQWPHLLYAATDRWTSMRRLVTMIAVMCEMKRRGCRIVWTMHNIYPHDRCVMPLLDAC